MKKTITIPQAFSSITKEQVKDWKKTKPTVRLLEIDLGEEDCEDESAKFYICGPTRNVIQAAATYSEDLDKANNILLKGCVLGGDMQFLNDENSPYDLYVPVLEAIGILQKARKSTIKKA